jgi:hypothetical protein
MQTWVRGAAQHGGQGPGLSLDSPTRPPPPPRPCLQGTHLHDVQVGPRFDEGPPGGGGQGRGSGRVAGGGTGVAGCRGRGRTARTRRGVPVNAGGGSGGGGRGGGPPDGAVGGVVVIVAYELRLGPDINHKGVGRVLAQQRRVDEPVREQDAHVKVEDLRAGGGGGEMGDFGRDFVRRARGRGAAGAAGSRRPQRQRHHHRRRLRAGCASRSPHTHLADLLLPREYEARAVVVLRARSRGRGLARRAQLRAAAGERAARRRGRARRARPLPAPLLRPAPARASPICRHTPQAPCPRPRPRPPPHLHVPDLPTLAQLRLDEVEVALAGPVVVQRGQRQRGGAVLEEDGLRRGVKEVMGAGVREARGVGWAAAAAGRPGGGRPAGCGLLPSVGGPLRRQRGPAGQRTAAAPHPEARRPHGGRRLDDAAAVAVQRRRRARRSDGGAAARARRLPDGLPAGGRRCPRNWQRQDRHQRKRQRGRGPVASPRGHRCCHAGRCALPPPRWGG